jgi:hypothetical protein
VTRGRLSLAALLLTLALAMVATRLARSEPPWSQGADRPSELATVVVDTRGGPLTAVVGAAGSVAPAVVVLPDRLGITVPGQGETTVEDAALLPGRQFATAVANLLGVWIPHHASLGRRELARVIDRSGGLEVDGVGASGSGVVALLGAEDEQREEMWRTTLEAILGGVAWEAVDLAEADSSPQVADLLNAARGARVEILSGEAGPGGVTADPAAIRAIVGSVFGAPDREVVPVIVLNGSGEPGVGERVAEHVIPGGFRVVMSENASTFDHGATAIVVAREADRPLGERVRDWLGVGEVQVADVVSDLADVTIVVGKDFSA